MTTTTTEQRSERYQDGYLDGLSWEHCTLDYCAHLPMCGS